MARYDDNVVALKYENYYLFPNYDDCEKFGNRIDNYAFNDNYNIFSNCDVVIDVEIQKPILIDQWYVKVYLYDRCDPDDIEAFKRFSKIICDIEEFLPNE